MIGLRRKKTRGAKARRQARSRVLSSEQLETRRLLTSDWHNACNAFDVSDDGYVTPIDALLPINRLNMEGAGQLPAPAPPDSPFLDTNDNGTLEPLDALLVINVLNGFSSDPAFSFEGGLSNDTGRETEQFQDGITSDARVAGNFRSLFGLESLTASVDGGPEIQLSHNCGSFTFDPDLALDGSNDGIHQVDLVGRDARGGSDAFEINFVLDTLSPPLEFGLSPDSDSGLPGDSATTLDTIQLSGSTQPGAVVEIDDTQVVVDAAGRFESSSLDTIGGTSSWTATAFDVAGNSTIASVDVTHTACDFEDDLISGTDQVGNIPWQGGFYDPLRPENSALPLASASADSVQYVTAIVNQDFVPDLVSLSKTSNEVLVQIGQGDNQFAPAARYSSQGSEPQAVSVADVIGDRLPDIIVGHSDGTLTFLEGIGDGQFRSRNELSQTGLGNIVDLSVRDVDGDLDQDVVVSGTDRLTLLTNDNDPVRSNPIRNGRFAHGASHWQTTIEGTTPGHVPGVVTTEDGWVQLVENNSFLVSLSQTFEVPPSPQMLEFELGSLHLESLAGSLPDAFEVSLLDHALQSVVPTFAPHATSFLNMTTVGESPVIRSGTGVSFDGSSVSLDISTLTPGEEVSLYVDLLGNQPGTGSVVTLGNFAVTPGAVYAETFTASAFEGPFGETQGAGTCDINGDGHSDVVVEDAVMGEFIEFMNDGHGGFERGDPSDGEGESTNRAIAIGEVVRDALASNSETDTFTFVANDGQNLFFDAQETTGLQVWTVTDPNGAQVFTSGLADRDVTPIHLTGTYTLSVAGFFGSQGDYQFQLHDVPDTTTTPVEIGAAVSGRLNVPGEQALFTFEGEEGQSLYFDSLLQVGSMSWTLTSPSGNVEFSDNLDDQDPILLNESGTYNLLVDGQLDQIGDFEFRINEVTPNLPLPVPFDTEISGAVELAGVVRAYSFSVNTGQQLYLDTQVGQTSLLRFRFLDSTNQVIQEGSFLDSGPMTIPANGEFLLQIDGVGDATEDFRFVLWDVPEHAVEPLLFEVPITGSIAVPGQVQRYDFAADAGDGIEFDAIFGSNHLVTYSLVSPSGTELFTSNGDETIASLPETGTYSLEVDGFGDAIGDYSFRVLDVSTPPIGNTPDLIVSNLQTPRSIVGSETTVEVNWEVTNQGLAPVPAGTRLTSFIHLSSTSSISDLASSPRIHQTEWVLESDLAPGQSLPRSVTVTLPAGLNADMEILVKTDALNLVFENQLEDNNVASSKIAIYSERNLQGLPILSFDLEDGTELPVGIPVTISGSTSVPAGAVNAVFMLDLSGSTQLIAGLDANFDGVADDADDLNGDGHVGDLLDKEIGLVLQTVARLQETVSDLRVAVVAWGMSNAAFPDAGESLDLGASRFNQTFVTPGSNAQVDGDFQAALTSIGIREQGLIEFAGADLFRPFVIGSGNNYDEALQEALSILDVAPDADANQIYFFTDGLFVPNEDVAANDATIDALSEREIQFRAAQVAGPELVTQLCSGNTPPDWCGSVETGDRYVGEVLRIVEGINQGPSTASIVLAEDPGDLNQVILPETRIAGVTINGRAVNSLDPAGGFFSVQELQPGENIVNARTIDSSGNSVDRQLVLVGVSDETPDFSQLEDVSSQATIHFTGTTWNRSANRLFADASVENVGHHTLAGPLLATLESLGTPLFTLANPNGQSAGISYFEFSDELPADGLQPGATSLPSQVQFDNPNLDRFSLDVQIRSLGNQSPQLSSAPIVVAEVGEVYQYDLVALDPDGHAIDYTLVSGPDGMQLDQHDGALTWTPSTEQLGTHPVHVKVVDPFGGLTSQSFHLTVLMELPNRPPLFQSAPPTQVASGTNYSYTPRVSDPDGDGLVITLEAAPAGMVLVDSMVTWSGTQSGNYEVELRATDSAGLSSTQAFVLTVGDSASNPHSPVILSSPSAIAAVGVPYFYLPLAQDPDGDALTFSLVTSPAGALLDGSTSMISWTPDDSQIGDQAFLLRVADGLGGFATQLFTVEVSEEATNLPPVFTSLPSLVATVGETYEYPATAFDYEAGDLTFRLVQAPVGMQIDPAGGEIAWTPSESQLGDQRVTVEVQDERGRQATQSFDLQVRPSPNVPPQFTSAPLTVTTVGNGYFYRPTALDDDDAFSIELLAGPAGMHIAEGLVEFFPTEDELGLHFVSLRATDERGASSHQNFEIEVQSDGTPPTVTIQFSSETVEPGAVVELLVAASDDVEIAEVSLWRDGTEVQLDSQGRASITPSLPGLMTFEAFARDVAGNEGSTLSVLRVIDPTDQTPPEVLVTLPLPGDSVQYLSEVLGTIAADDLELYQVEVASAELIDTADIAGGIFDDSRSQGVWKTLATSNEPVNAGVLAELDPTVLPNGDYFLRVFAQDFSGNADVKVIPLTVDGPAKLGEYSLDFVDLSITLAGLPIEVNRRYSTLDASKSSDFGYGWSLGWVNPDIRETVAPGDEGQAGLFGQTPFVNGTRVYITNPDGDRVGFTFEPELAASFFGQAYTPKFTPDPGVSDQLIVDPITLSQNSDGTFAAFLVGFPYNPSEYQLVRPDGMVYQYDDRSGLQSVSNRNGNKLTYTTDGISHSSGESVEFVRDALGRITQIIDSAGLSISYQYNAAGELIAVTDQAGVLTQFEYLTAPAHYLSEVIGPSGAVSQRTEYDDQGRILATIDGEGNRIEQHWDPANFSGTIIDGNNNVTALIYDQRGNILVERDPLGFETYYEYSDSRHPDLETRITDRRGFVIEREYDERGNIARITEVGHKDSPFDAPIVTSFTFNEANQITSRTDARDNTTSWTYDDHGNLTEVKDALGNISSRSYDDMGRLTTYTDFNRNVTTLHYTDGDQATKIEFADRSFIMLDHNHLGQIIQREYYEADGSLSEIFRSTFDGTGRVLEETRGQDGLPGHHPTTVRQVYQGKLVDYEVVINPQSLDDSGQLTESTDTPIHERRSSFTEFEYDENGLVTRQVNPSGSTLEFRYDANGNRILLKDPVGNITTWVYDSLNRISETRDPFYNENLSIQAALAALREPSGANCDQNLGAVHVTLACYDEEGNQTKKIDRNGRRIEWDHDHAGHVVQERWFNAVGELESTTHFTYDVVGNQLTASSPGSHLVFTYDELDRQLTVDNAAEQTPPGPRLVLTHTYDAEGNLTRTEDDSGVVVSYEFNERNLPASIQWSGTGIDPARVDFIYNSVGRETEILRFADLSAEQLISRTQRSYDFGSASDGIIHEDGEGRLLANYDYDYDHAGLIDEVRFTHHDQALSNEIDFAYDLAGQVVQSQQTGSDLENFEFDANGNPVGADVVQSTGNQIQSDGQFEYEYDDEGNLIKKTEITTGIKTTYSYDHRNRLTHVEARTTGGIVLFESTYQYDALGRRISTTVNGETVFTAYDGDNAWMDQDASGVMLTRYLFGQETDQILARYRQNAGTAWHLKDKLGTVRDLVANNGAPLTHIAFDAFGGLRSNTDTELAGRHLFTGREFDAASELYYYRARYYNPTLGRFISQDPLGFEAHDSNLYRYVLNSPLNFKDPTGMASALEYTFSRAFWLTIVSYNASSIGAACQHARTGQPPVTLWAGTFSTATGATVGTFAGATLVPGVVGAVGITTGATLLCLAAAVGV